MDGTEELIGLFPPGSSRDGDGMVMVGGCRLDDVARGYGTPVMVVAEDAFAAAGPRLPGTAGRPLAGLPCGVASKAFPCTAVQRLMVSEGLWIDVAGGGEIVTALAAGADPATLVLHGNAKSTEEVQLAVRSGVGTGVVDDLDDIDRLEAAVPPATNRTAWYG